MPRKIPTEWLDEIERQYLSAKPTRDIERDCVTLFGRSRRSVQKYMGIVHRRLAAKMKTVDPDTEKARVESMLLEAFDIARIGHADRGSDAKGMVAAAYRLGELHGVMAPRKVELSGKVDTAPEALHERLAAMAARAAAGADPRGPGSADRG